MIAEPIATARLLLTPLDPADATEMVTVLADAEIYRFTGGTPPTLDALERRYRAQVAGSPDPHETWLNWIVRRAADQRAVGLVQATVGDATADVAWIIGVESQGNGFATEAARAMAEWLRSNGVTALVAHIHPRHIASRRVAMSIGLAPTGDVDEDGEDIWRREPAVP